MTQRSDFLNWGVVVLAAGQGTRMRSSTPKVLHEIGGQALIDHVLDRAFEFAPASNIRVVVGHGADLVRTHIARREVTTALQDPQLGTGHALDVGLAAFSGQLPDAVLVLSGDVPLLRSATLGGMRQLLEAGADAVLLTADLKDPGSYGRVLRDPDDQVSEIVEARDADETTLACTEVNAGIYAFRFPPLRAALANLETDNAQGEYYLTDVVALMKSHGRPISAVMLDDWTEMNGVNTRQDLARAGATLNRRIIDSLMEAGVTVVDPESTWIDINCQVEPDVVLEPGVILRGECQIGAGVRIGAHSVCCGITISDGESVPPLSRLV